MAHGTLYIFCGKMGAGKSTRARELATQKNAVLLSEDDWLHALYPDQITSLEDYIHYANLLKPQIKQLAQSVLATGADVVMDYPANTLAQRAWLRRIFSEIAAPHLLVYLPVPDQVCLERIQLRRLSEPSRAATDTEAMFHAVTKHFVEPTPKEGFALTVLQPDESIEEIREKEKTVDIVVLTAKFIMANVVLYYSAMLGGALAFFFSLGLMVSLYFFRTIKVFSVLLGITNVVLVLYVLVSFASGYQLGSNYRHRTRNFRHQHANLDRQLRVFPDHMNRGWLHDTGLKIALRRHQDARLYRGFYPTAQEARRLLDKGAIVGVNDLKRLDKASTIIGLERESLTAIASTNDMMIERPVRSRLVGVAPFYLRYVSPLYLDDLKRGFKWQSCGSTCRVIEPVVKYKDRWLNAGGYYFLVETEQSIIFAQYPVRKKAYVYKYIHSPDTECAPWEYCGHIR